MAIDWTFLLLGSTELKLSVSKLLVDHSIELIAQFDRNQSQLKSVYGCKMDLFLSKSSKQYEFNWSNFAITWHKQHKL